MFVPRTATAMSGAVAVEVRRIDALGCGADRDRGGLRRETGVGGVAKETATAPALRLVVARSGRPSALKSAATTSRGVGAGGVGGASAVKPVLAALRR